MAVKVLRWTWNTLMVAGGASKFEAAVAAAIINPERLGPWELYESLWMLGYSIIGCAVVLWCFWWPGPIIGLMEVLWESPPEAEEARR